MLRLLARLMTNAPRRGIAFAVCWVLLLAGLLAGSVFTTPARAATGDVLRTIKVNPAPSCANINVGITFDGSELLVSNCPVDSTPSNVVTRVNPVDGSALGTLTIDGVAPSEGIGAISWDRKNNQLWLATGNIVPQKVYSAVLNKSTGRGTATLRFTFKQDGLGLIDGLTFDGTDDSIWMNSDRFPTIFHFSLDGKLLGQIASPGGANSGIAMQNATTLYLMSPNSTQITSTTKDGKTSTPLVNTNGQGNEGLTCDLVTFAPKGALWVIVSVGFQMIAIEVPPDQCAMGGVVGTVPAPTAGPSPTPRATPSVTAVPSTTAVPAPGGVCPPTAPFFPETGFCIDNPAIQAYFLGRGGVDTFGFPASRTFRLLGFTAQVFQRHVLRVHPDGVKPMNLLDPDVLPVTTVNFATFPAHDPALAASAPPPTTPNYGQAVLAHLQANVPNSFQGVDVQFLNSYLSAGRQAAGASDLPALVGLEIWGFPTSRPARDPNNANFVYQRFQRGILHSFPNPSNPGQRVTRGILLADNLKFVLTNDPVLLPADLRAQVLGSRFFNQYCPANPAWLCRPTQLPDTDLTAAFATQHR